MIINLPQTFTLYWSDGNREVVNGGGLAEAMTIAGYSQGAVRALDFYALGDHHEYAWVPEERKWKQKVSSVYAL